MGHLQTTSRERGGWTPFVGVALAVVTAGSLVLFSFVAQRTSQDGFSTRGVTAIRPSDEPPNAITLPAGPVPSPRSAGTDAGPTASPLLTLSPTNTSDVADGDRAPATGPVAEPDPDVDVAAAPSANPSSTDGLDARFDDGGFSPQFFRDGAVRAAAEDSDGLAAKAKGPGKEKKAKKVDKKSRTASVRKGRGEPRSARGNRARAHSSGRSEAHSQGSSHRSKRSNDVHVSRPAQSSRPAPAPPPQRAPKAKAKPQHPAGHSNSTGKGHSKGRGRGHAHD